MPNLTVLAPAGRPLVVPVSRVEAGGPSPDKLPAEVMERADYMNLVALRLGGEAEAAACFFWSAGAKRIRSPVLRGRALALLGEDSPALEAYRVDLDGPESRRPRG